MRRSGVGVAVRGGGGGGNGWWRFAGAVLWCGAMIQKPLIYPTCVLFIYDDRSIERGIQQRIKGYRLG